MKYGVVFGKEQLDIWVILHLTCDLHPVTLNNTHFGGDAYLWLDHIKIYKKKKNVCLTVNAKYDQLWIFM